MSPCLDPSVCNFPNGRCVEPSRCTYPREKRLESDYPGIEWREPIPVRHPGGEQRYACRICIAQNGLKGSEVYKLWKTPELAREHIKEAH